MLGINENDVKDYRVKVEKKKKENDNKMSKKYVFGDSQTMMGVFKVINESGRVHPK